MPASASEVIAQVRAHHQHVLATLLTGLAVGLGRAFDLADPIGMAIATLLFLAGVFGAHFVFLFDEQIQATAHRRLPLGEVAGGPGRSPLRQGLMLLLLPVLALFLVSSTRAALGLGFFWGLSAVYWWELVHYFGPEAARLHETYFPSFPAGSLAARVLVVAFLGYGLLLTGGLLLVRGTP